MEHLTIRLQQQKIMKEQNNLENQQNHQQHIKVHINTEVKQRNKIIKTKMKINI